MSGAFFALVRNSWPRVYTDCMLEKTFLIQVLSRIKAGGLEITFWDNETRRFGPEKPWVKLRINDPTLIREMRRNTEMAIGEGYMHGRVDIEGDLAELGRLGDVNQRYLEKYLPLLARKPGKRVGSKRKEAANIEHHYDLGNDFYRLWLDKSMTYSCAYFKKKSDTLERAQQQKVDHILKKLYLKKGMTLLDIGSGWGELITRAAKKYGVKAHGITLSKEQLAKTKERIKTEKLGRLVSVELKHYDDLKASRPFDRVVSVGMYEHVGPENHDQYMAAVDRALKPGGLSMLHTITQNIRRPMSPWINKYIFPGGYIPALEEVIEKLPGHDFHAVDVESLRRHYALTLDEWARRYERHVDVVRDRYGEEFVRMWRLYLRGSYAGFQWGNLDLHQILFTKGLTDDLPLTREYMYR